MAQSAGNLVTSQAGNYIMLPTTFVAPGVAAPIRHLLLSQALSDAGVGLTTTAGSGAMGISRTAGTSFVLVGETTSSSAVTDKVLWSITTPETYISGNNINVLINGNYSGTGTITAASTTLTVAAYSLVAGVETALTVSAAQRLPATATVLTFVITGTNLTPLGVLLIELTMLVTSSSGANTGQINEVQIQA
jgi:hypothetical protein